MVSGVPFNSFSWPDKSVPHGFHRFGEENAGNPTFDPPDKALTRYDFLYSTGSPPPGDADLQTIYGGEWARLFATVSLHEDFVETYKLLVLIQGTQPLTALSVTIPNGSNLLVKDDILCSNLANPNTKLYKKAAWIISYLDVPNQLPVCSSRPR